VPTGGRRLKKDRFPLQFALTKVGAGMTEGWGIYNMPLQGGKRGGADENSG